MKVPIKLTINWEWDVPMDSPHIIEDVDWYIEGLCLHEVIEDIAKFHYKVKEKDPHHCYFCCKGDIERI